MDTDLSTILDIVRDMPPTGAGGFEGLVGSALESVVGVPFRLSSSGFQRGVDGRSVGEGAVTFEAKRYGEKDPARESVLVKLVDSANNGDEADLWILAATVGVSAQLAQDVTRAGEREGLATLILDWPDVSCPPLATLLAMAEPAVLAFFETHSSAIDRSALATALANVRAKPSFGRQSVDVQARISAPTTGVPLARRAATDRLRELFSDERAARQHLGQALAPRSPTAQSVKRGTTFENVTKALGASSDKLVAVIGPEGNGKSWVVADAWSSLVEPPLTAFVPAEALVGVRSTDASKAAMELLLRASGSDESRVSRTRWERVWDRWKRSGPCSEPRFSLVVDGLNQHPSTEWGRLCDALSHEVYVRGGQLVVTCRDAFFRARVKPKLVAGATVIDIPEWTDGERDKILIEHRLDPRALMPSTRAALRNPRILAVALSLHSSTLIESMEELSVSRLLFEHLRLADRDLDVSVTAAEFSGSLQRLAEQALERVKAEVIDDIFVFEGDLTATREGRFFQPIDNEHRRYKLLDDGVDLALGLALVDVARSAERNDRNIPERLAARLEPVSALDKTANALFAAVTVACLDDSVSEPVCSALIGALFHIQNIDQNFFGPLSSLVQKRPQPFMSALEADARRVTRGDLGRCLLASLRRVRSRPEAWAAMSRVLSRWLRTYSLAPSGRYANGRQSVQDKQLAYERERDEIGARVGTLNKAVRAVLDSGHLDEGFERGTLSKLAFSLMAGMPLTNFAGDLVAWRLAAALRPGFEEPTNEFAHLICFNLSDWRQTRDALLEAVEVLRGDTSESSQLALRGVLDATGDPADAADAEQIRVRLLASRETPEWMRSPQPLPEPCDPLAAPNNALDAQGAEYAAIPASMLRTQMGTTSEDWTFTKLGPAVARFAAEMGVAKIRELIADVLKRSNFSLRQGLLELRKHNMLIGRSDALQLAQRLHDGLSASTSELSETDRLIATQYHLLLAFPQLSAEEQVAAMTTPESTTDFLLELLPQVKPLPVAEFTRRFADAHHNGSRVELYVLLAFAAENALTIPADLHAPLLAVALGEDQELRARAQALILATAHSELLRDFEASGWTVEKTDDEEGQDRWLGSWILIEAARHGFGDTTSLLERLEPQLWAAAAKHLGGSIAEGAASRLVVVLPKVAGLSRDLMLPDLEFSFGSHVERAMPRFHVSPAPETPESLHDGFVLASESSSDFNRRQEGARAQFDAFKAELTRNQAHLVLESISIAEMKALLAARPSLLDGWRKLLDYPATNVSALFNIGVTMAGAIAGEQPAMAHAILERLSTSSPYVRQAYLGRQVELFSHVIWNAPREAGFESRQHALLDAAFDDHDIATEVLAALDAGRTDTLERYASDLLDSGLPSRMARALTVVGFSLPSTFIETTLQDYADHAGMVGAAARAAGDAYRRHGWAEHWFGKMRDADDHESLWQASQLFRKCVDARFEVLREQVPKGSDLFERYKESVFADLHNLYAKRSNERKKTLFGTKAPAADFLAASG